MRRVAVLALCMACAGCSLFMRRVPPGWHESEEPDCTATTVPPKLDAVVGVPLTLLGAVFVSASLISCDSGDTDDTNSCAVPFYLGVPMLLIGVPYSLSSLQGFRIASKCKRAHRRHREWMSTR